MPFNFGTSSQIEDLVLYVKSNNTGITKVRDFYENGPASYTHVPEKAFNEIEIAWRESNKSLVAGTWNGSGTFIVMLVDLDHIDANKYMYLKSVPYNRYNLESTGITRTIEQSDNPFYANWQTIYDFGLYSSYASTDEDIHLSISTKTGKSYKFSFEGCSPSGIELFDEADKQAIQIKNAEDVIAQTYWDENASDVFQQYEINFIADGDNIIINYPFDKIKNYKVTSFKIKKLALYENED
jgi:hypothetical protein